MTIPIIPGPFSFLSEAGQAAGDIGRAKEEREARAQKIAEHASTSILDQIMAGGDPAILDSPETQKVLKTAGYPPLTSSHFQFVGGAAAALGAAGRAKIKSDVPGREAAAAGTAADVSARTGQAQLSVGLPELDAEAKAAQARAAGAGAEFNVTVYNAARQRFGDIKDPEFRNLAIDAATGVLDYRIRRLESNRYRLTFERQLMADKTRLLLESMRNQEGVFKELNDNYEKQRRIDMFKIGADPNDEKITRQYEQIHPRPSMEDAQNAILKSQGVSPDEFKNLMRHTYDLQAAPASAPGGPGAPTGDPGGAAPPTFASSDLSEAFSQLQSATDPDVAGRQFAEALNAGVYSISEARLVFQEAKKKLPAAQYRKLRDAFNKNVTPPGGAPPPIDNE
jgi:osmotically-inducible protein OsmY